MLSPHHFGEELLDADAGGKRGKTLEQPRRYAAPLVLVGHCEGNFGGVRIAQAHIARQRDDDIVLRADERAPFDPVGFEHGVDKALVHARMSVEAEIEAPVRQPAEEVEQRLAIRRSGRAESHRRAVAEDDVRHGLCSCIHERRGCHSRQASASRSVMTSGRSRSPIAD